MNFLNKGTTSTGSLLNPSGNQMGGTTNPTSFGLSGQTGGGFGGATSGIGSTAFNKPIGGTSLGGTSSSTLAFGSTGQSFIQQQPSVSTGSTNLGLNSQTQPSTGGLFGGVKPTTGFTTTPQMTGYGTQGQGLGAYSGQGGMQTTQPSATNINYAVPLVMNQTNPPVFSLLPTNYLKYEKISTLQDDIKRLIGKIELDLKNNEIFLDYADNMFKGLNENFKIISGEGVKVVKFCKLINSKNSKIKFILDTLKIEIEQQSELLKKERKNFHIIEQHPTFKISIPSEYFFNLTKEIEEKMALQIQQISDLESLINLYYRKEYGSFKINSDIVEELIRELYNCLISLVSEAARVNEYVNALKINYMELMKYNYGWKELEIENRIRAHMALGEEIENIYYK
jgi:hypothetical protein